VPAIVICVPNLATTLVVFFADVPSWSVPCCAFFTPCVYDDVSAERATFTE